MYISVNIARKEKKRQSEFRKVITYLTGKSPTFAQTLPNHTFYTNASTTALVRRIKGKPGTACASGYETRRNNLLITRCSYNVPYTRAQTRYPPHAASAGLGTTPTTAAAQRLCCSRVEPEQSRRVRTRRRPCQRRKDDGLRSWSRARGRPEAVASEDSSRISGCGCRRYDAHVVLVRWVRVLLSCTVAGKGRWVKTRGGFPTQHMRPHC